MRISPVLLFVLASTVLASGLAAAEPQRREPAREKFFAALASATQPDGKVVLVGAAPPDTISYSDAFAVSRHNADGSLDTTFGGGVVNIPIWGYIEWANAIALAPDGSIFVGGNAYDTILHERGTVNCHPAFCGTYPAVVKLKSDGTIDPSFNGGRPVALNIGGYNAFEDVPGYGYLRSLAVRDDGKVIVGTDQMEAARLNADGSLDTTFAGAYAVAIIPAGASDANFQGLWWGGEAEAGWNLTFSHQQDIVFATWATYDRQGKATWYSMTARQIAPSSYEGTLYQATGPRLDQGAYDEPTLQLTDVGKATIVFTSASDARFAYTVEGVEDQKTIRRFEVAGTQPECQDNVSAQPLPSGNLSDLWLANPAGSAPGWAVAISDVEEVNGTLSLTMLTYDLGGSPMWLFGSGTFVGYQFQGDLYLTSGSPITARYDPAALKYTPVGSFTIDLGDSDHLLLKASVMGISLSRQITRFVFRGFGTRCSYPSP